MAFLLTLTSTILLLATVAGSLPVRGALYDTLSHFMLQYAIAAAILCVLSLIYFSTFSLGAAVIALALSVFQLAPYLPRASETSAVAAQVRILQTNMLFTNRRIGGLMHLLESDAPDIVVVSEANSGHVAYLRDNANLLPYQVSTAKDKGSFGMAIASRLELDNVQTHHFVHDSIVAYSFDIRLDTQVVTILSIHPSNPLKNFGLRDRELAVVARWVKAQKNPVIVTGDFNITPYAYAYKYLLRDTGLLDVRKGRGINGTFHSRLPAFLRIPIDHTLYSEQLAVVDYKTAHINNTDHRATVVTIGTVTQ